MYILPHTRQACHHPSFGLEEDIKVPAAAQQVICKEDPTAGVSMGYLPNAHGLYFQQPMLHTEQFPNGMHLKNPDTINNMRTQNLDTCFLTCN